MAKQELQGYTTIGQVKTALDKVYGEDVEVETSLQFVQKTKGRIIAKSTQQDNLPIGASSLQYIYFYAIEKGKKYKLKVNVESNSTGYWGYANEIVESITSSATSIEGKLVDNTLPTSTIEKSIEIESALDYSYIVLCSKDGYVPTLKEVSTKKEGGIDDLNDRLDDQAEILAGFDGAKKSLDGGTIVLSYDEHIASKSINTNGELFNDPRTGRWSVNKYDVSNIIGTITGNCTDYTSSKSVSKYRLEREDGTVKNEILNTVGDVDFEIFLDGTYTTLYVVCRGTDFDNDISFEEVSYDDVRFMAKKNERILDDVCSADILLPSKVYAIVGKELDLYYDAFVNIRSNGLNGISPYSVSVSCKVGKSYERYYQYTPVASEVGDHTLSVVVYDAKYRIIANKEITLVVLSSTQSLSTKTILMVGDSTLDNSEGICPVTETLKSSIESLGNTQNFVGQMGTAPNKNCGMMGRGYLTYTSYGYTYYKFNFASGTTSRNAVYSCNGSTYKVVEVNATYINTSLVSGSGSRPDSGTLTKVSGSGDSTIAYTSVSSSPSNPFWNSSTSKIDIAMYRSNIGVEGNIDIVSFRLGANDCFSSKKYDDDNIKSIISSAKTLIQAFVEDNANTKIIVELNTIDANTKDGWGKCVGASANSKEIYEYNMWKLAKAIIDTFDEGEYSANVSVCATCAGMDRYYGYPLIDTTISSRYNITEKRHNEYVHPCINGYYQIADIECPHYVAVINGTL